LVGSDSLDPFVFTGEGLHRELAEMVRAGLKPAEALEAATKGAVDFVGRSSDFGTIEVGKRADLVLLDGSPLENIANTQRILGVVRDGNYLDRAGLDKLLAQAKSAAASVPPAK
jgi:imidazolonepropionase-like amidohydrolase